MPVPSHDFGSVLKGQANFADLMRCARAVLTCWEKPVAMELFEEHYGDGMRFELVDERLVPAEFNCCWTEHSERA
eukprot:5130654-Karenia_brevis.AAC.1